MYISRWWIVTLNKVVYVYFQMVWTVSLNKVVYVYFQMVDRLDAQEGGQTEIKQESAIQVKQILHVKSPK